MLDTTTTRMLTVTARGLALIDQGMSVRKAAEAVGVAPSTLVRARKREGLPARPTNWQHL